MASKRRGGFRPPELRGTLGTLLRTTTGVVRDALERGAREGRARLDIARASFDSARAGHRRHDALADLGELILDLIRRGEIDLAELPEARDLVRELDQLDEDTAATSSANDDDRDDEPAPPRAASRRRFDDRGPRRDSSSFSRSARSLDSRARSTSTSDDDRRPRRDSSSSDDDSRARRDSSSASSESRRHASLDDSRRRHRDSDDDLPRVRRNSDDDLPRRRRDSDDGTVSSGAVWRPTLAERPTAADRADRATIPDRPRNAESNSSRAPTKPIKGIWRPQIDDAPPIPDNRDRFHDRTNRDRGDLRDRTDRDTQREPHDRPSRDTEATDRPTRDTDREPSDRPAHDTEHDHPSSSDRSDRRPSFPRDPTRKGGISFDDEDLADYMHPDDVPTQTPAKDPDDHEA